MVNNKKKSFVSQTNSYVSNNYSPDFDRFYDMEEEGLPLSDIAKELNINEKFLSSMVNEMYKEK